jgi:hypothetical protein
MLVKTSLDKTANISKTKAWIVQSVKAGQSHLTPDRGRFFLFTAMSGSALRHTQPPTHGVLEVVFLRDKAAKT